MEERNAHFDEISDRLNSLGLIPTQERWKALDDLIPDSEEQHEYCQYILSRALSHLHPSKILTPAQFVELADSINFVNPTERKKLLPALTGAYRPWIPLGSENTVSYRLRPSVHNLTPQKTKYPTTNLDVLDLSFLGVNTTVQPREPSLPLNRRALNMSEESTQSAESDDMEAPGFVFHELGELQCLECETAEGMPATLEEGDELEGDWEQTGFSVVARLSNTGHIDGVYVIYNMNPRQEDDGKRQQVTHSKWGIPPSSPREQFSCARIGSTMQEFGFKHNLEWNEQVHHPVELVWAVISPMGAPMRVTVDKDYRMHM